LQGNILLLIAVMLPVLAAPVAYAAGRRQHRRALLWMAGVSAASFLLLSVVLYMAVRGQTLTFAWEQFGVMGLHLAADGFRALFAWLSALLFTGASIYSVSYFKTKTNVPRFVFFTLLTLSAVIGLFVSDRMLTTVMFFEVMSLASYPWVAHEETPEALRAAQSYLWIAIIGGLCMLMGMLLLPAELWSLSYSQGLPRGVDASRLMLPAVLMLIGFGAKAGAFPLHVWLPRAYPAAPAPAAALLSAVLSKAGVFGVLLLSVYIMGDMPAWHTLIFWIGIVTMLVGGVWALLSMNIMRVLAWSSMSQIGFILVGAGLYGLLSAHGSIAAQGLFAHMVNHSLFKAILFLCAGIAVMNVGKRHLNDLRGFGRGKPWLHFAFLMGMLGVAGVPLWSGFASKSMLHESLTAYLHLLPSGAWPYAAAEWLFILSGGMTVAYMLKLYICLFWEHPEGKPDKRPYAPRTSLAVILTLSVFPLLMGLFPALFMDGLSGIGARFLLAHAEPFAVFSAENLLGAAWSIAAGLILYFVVIRGLLSEKIEGGRGYMNPVPARVNLEDIVYRPALKALEAAVAWFSWAVAMLPEALLALLRRALLHVRAWRVPMPGGNRFTSALGELLNGVAWLLNRTVRKKHPIDLDFACALAATNEELGRSMKRLKRSLSYNLLLFCVGLFGLLAYLIFV